MTKILENLKWKSLKQRRFENRLILFYTGLNKKANIPVKDLNTPKRINRKSHDNIFKIPYARTDSYKFSFFPKTIRDWNALPQTIITEAANSENSIPTFINLIRNTNFV